MSFYNEFDDWDDLNGDWCVDNDCKICYPAFSDGLDKDPSDLVGDQDDDN